MSTRINQNAGSSNLNAASLVAKKTEPNDSRKVETSKAQIKKSVQVQLSDTAREVSTAKQKALDIAMNTSDVRMDKVEALKAKIQNGEYKVDPELIAEGIVREALMEEIAWIGTICRN